LLSEEVSLALAAAKLQAQGFRRPRALSDQAAS
jgi:hypothetical protein